MTKHQYYLQLRKDILEERLRCDTENAMLLASLALQAEFSDYQPEVRPRLTTASPLGVRVWTPSPKVLGSIPYVQSHVSKNIKVVLGERVV
jgi:hypothetical protein